MRTGGNTALTVRGACLAAGLAFCFGLVQADVSVHVAITDEAISIRARDTSLRNVLEELSRQSNLTIMSQDPLDDLVTVDIAAQSLPEAVRRLLRQKSFMLHQLNYLADRPDGASYNRLWIFSEGPIDGGWATRTLPSPASDISSELIDYQLLALSAKSGDREEAMYGFGEFGGSNDVEYLQQGLSDPDENVREEAIESLVELGGTESVQALSLVLHDPDISIRIDAVDALGEIGGQEAMKLLQEAMADENHTVREAAAEWLTELAWQRD